MPLVQRTSNQGNVYRESIEPPNWLNGDLWIDTDNAIVYVNNAGSAQVVGLSSARIVALG